MTDHTRYDLPTRPEPQAASAAPASVCPDCGGRGWRRQMGATACACLVRDVRQQAARLAEQDEQIAALRARLDALERAIVLPAVSSPPLDFTPAPLGGMTCNMCGTHWPAVWLGIIPPCTCRGQYQTTYAASP